jgi:hypothetical protein
VGRSLELLDGHVVRPAKNALQAVLNSLSLGELALHTGAASVVARASCRHLGLGGGTWTMRDRVGRSLGLLGGHVVHPAKNALHKQSSIACRSASLRSILARRLTWPGRLVVIMGSVAAQGCMATGVVALTRPGRLLVLSRCWVHRSAGCPPGVGQGGSRPSKAVSPPTKVPGMRLSRT